MGDCLDAARICVFTSWPDLIRPSGMALIAPECLDGRVEHGHGVFFCVRF